MKSEERRLSQRMLCDVVVCAVLCSELQRAAEPLPATPVLSELNTVSLLVPIS